jgi:hypothetical protein
MALTPLQEKYSDKANKLSDLAAKIILEANKFRQKAGLIVGRLLK